MKFRAVGYTYHWLVLSMARDSLVAVFLNVAVLAAIYYITIREREREMK